MNVKLIRETTVYYTSKAQVGYAGRYSDKMRRVWKKKAMYV
jgi:hypothetical protein